MRVSSNEPGDRPRDKIWGYIEATIRAGKRHACILTYIDTDALTADKGLECYQNVPCGVCCPCWIQPTHELFASYQHRFGSQMKPDLPDANSTPLQIPRLSITNFLLHIFSKHVLPRRFLYVMTTIHAIAAVVALKVQCSQCRPARRLWDKSVNGTCLDPTIERDL